MFNPFKKSKAGESVIFKISGMHCTSCSMNIDGTLEDTDGVVSAETTYASARSVIRYDEKRVTKEKLKTVVESLGYSVSEIS